MVETSPARAILPPKISVFRFSKATFSSLMMSLPDTLLSVRLSYNTVPALALRVQSKKAGTLIADAVVLLCVVLAVVAVAVVAGLLEAVAGCIKSLTTNLLDDRLKFPFSISFLKTNPYRLSIVPFRCRSVLPVRASKAESPMCEGLKAILSWSI